MIRRPFFNLREGAAGGWDPHEKRVVPETVQLNAETKRPIGLVSREEELEAKRQERLRTGIERAESRAARELALKQAIDAANESYVEGDDDWLEDYDQAEPLTDKDQETRQQMRALDDTAEILDVSDLVGDKLIDTDATLPGQPGWDAGDTLDVAAPTRKQAAVSGASYEALKYDDTVDLVDSHAEYIEQPGSDNLIEDYDLHRADGTVMHIESERVESTRDFLDSVRAGGTVQIGNRIDTKREGRPRVPNQFNVVKELGGGAMGATYLARNAEDAPDAPPAYVVKIHINNGGDPQAKQRMAAEEISVLHEFTDLAEGIRRYEDEDGNEVILTAMKLANGKPGELIPEGRELLGVAEEDLQPFEVPAYEAAKEMETVPGLLKATRAMRALLDQVKSFQHRGVVHGDIKPANMILSEAGDVSTFIDTGLARQLVDNDGTVLHNQKHGIVRGTLTTMLPDLIRGREEQSVNGDIYSTAVSIAEIIGVLKPAPSQSITDYVLKLVRGEGYSVPDIQDREGRAEFIERFGVEKLKIYQVLEKVIQPHANIMERHRAWVGLGLMHDKTDKVFEGASRSTAESMMSRAMSDEEYAKEMEEKGLDGLQALEEIEDIESVWSPDKVPEDKRAEVLDVLRPEEILDIDKIQAELEAVEEELVGISSGAYPAVNDEMVERWIDTGRWPAAV